MFPSKMMDDFMNVNMETMDAGQLADIRTLEFDNSLSKEQRLHYVLEKLKNPFCFRCENMGIQLDFDDSKPSMEEVLTQLLIRQKSGL